MCVGWSGSECPRPREQFQAVHSSANAQRLEAAEYLRKREKPGGGGEVSTTWEDIWVLP